MHAFGYTPVVGILLFKFNKKAQVAICCIQFWSFAQLPVLKSNHWKQKLQVIWNYEQSVAQSVLQWDLFRFNFNWILKRQSHSSFGHLFSHDLLLYQRHAGKTECWPHGADILVVASYLWSSVFSLPLSHFLFFPLFNVEILWRSEHWQDTHLNDYYPFKSPGPQPINRPQIKDFFLLWLLWHHGVCPSLPYMEHHPDLKRSGSHNRQVGLGYQTYTWWGLYP